MAALSDLTFRDLFRPDYISCEIWEIAQKEMDGIALGKIILSEDKTHFHILIDEAAQEQFIKALKLAMNMSEEVFQGRDPDWWKS